MELIDIILLIIIAGFAMFGLWFGLIHTLGSLLGTIVGAYTASRLYEPMADWLIAVTGWGENTSRVFMFIIAFVIINRLVGFLFWIVERFTKIFTNLPFIKGINRFLGLLFGLFEGVLTIGLIIYFIERFPVSDWFMGHLATSAVAPMTTSLAGVLLPLLPEALQLLRSSIDYVEGVVL
ncbi:CvpA family protein [Patescibacteria group bacterium]|nr:CvpA family protein [Patescibacteria group bacterium]MBU1895994.1 CvpA family protein [Patescibacteria group bacterium]